MNKIKIINFTPYIPRECGIATYLKNLRDSYERNILSSVIAIDDSSEKLQYPKEVIKLVNYDSTNDYIKTAEYINNTNYDVIHIQHEFGLFGGEDGSYLVETVSRLKKQFVITFHTVLSNPSTNQKKQVVQLSKFANKIIVMAEVAKNRLKENYNVPESKIAIIPHGVPEFKYVFEDRKLKEKLNVSDRRVLSTFGLLGRNKGIEFVLMAMPKIISKVPNALFLVVGKTHPVILRQNGEEYRNQLIKLSSKLGITQNVKFINQYLTTEQIGEYLKITDLYITPYLEPEQITSGTLAYALGAGKACVSTNYPYAVEMLSNDIGIIVPFRNSQAIADSVIKVFSNDSYRQLLSERSYRIGKSMRWRNVASQHSKLFHSINTDQYL